MDDLCSRYISFLRDEGVIAPDYRSGNLKLRIQPSFGGKVQFVCTSVTESEVVLASEVGVTGARSPHFWFFHYCGNTLRKLSVGLFGCSSAYILQCYSDR